MKTRIFSHQRQLTPMTKSGEPSRLSSLFVQLTSIVALLIFPVVGMSQSEIKGTVTSESGEEVHFVPVILTDTNQQAVALYDVTSQNGEFTLKGIQAGDYTLQVKGLGFDDFQSEPFIIDGKRETLLTKDIVLTQHALQLEGVTVSTQRPLFSQRADRLVYNVENAIASQGGDAIDALKNTPLLRIDENTNSISMLGKSSLRVLINGRPLNLSGSELISYLRTIPNDNISTIEIITTPPARYEAEGNSGLINIVLKINPNHGWSGSIANTSTQRTHYSNNSSLNLNYQSEKLSLTSTFGYGLSQIKAYEGYENLFENGFSNLGFQNKRTENNAISSSINANYKLSPKLEVGLLYDLHHWDFLSDDSSNRRFYDGSQLLNLLNNHGLGELKGTYQRANLFAIYQLDENGKTAEIGVQYMVNSMDQDRQNKSSENNVSEITDNLSENMFGIWIANLDLNLPFDWLNLQAGARMSLINNNSNIRFYNVIDGQDMLDPLRSNKFDFEEAISAAYVSAQKNLGEKWMVQGGMRYEFTSNQGFDDDDQKVTARDFGGWFPSFYLSYNAAENQTWTFRYSRRVNRPRMNQLNPFRWFINPALYLEGNPLLQPSFVNNPELSFSNNKNFSATLYYSATKSSATTVPVFIEDGKVSYLTTLNALDMQQYGVYSNYVITAIPGLQSQLSGSLYWNQSETKIEDKVPSTEGFGTSLSANNSYTLAQGHTLLLNYQHNFPSVQGNMETDSYGFISAGYRVRLLENNLTLGIIGSALISKNREIAYRQFLPQGVAHGVNEYDYTSLRVTVNFRFGNIKVSGSQQRKNTEEENRIR